MMGAIRNTWFLALAWSLLLCGCSESDNFVQKKFDSILRIDLDTIIAGVQKNGLLDTPYFRILSYKSYNEGIYSKLAVVEFFFLKTIKAKIVRKYRYVTEAGLWDRYFNEYKFYDDSTKTKP